MDLDGKRIPPFCSLTPDRAASSISFGREDREPSEAEQVAPVALSPAEVTGGLFLPKSVAHAGVSAPLSPKCGTHPRVSPSLT